MKTTNFLLTLCAFLLLASYSNAQLNVSLNGYADDEAQNILFRGFANILEISSNEEGLEYTIETANVVSTQVAISDDPNVKRYIVKIGREKTVSFKFHKKGEEAVFQTVTCQVSNLPDPTIHFDGVPSKGKIATTGTAVTCKHVREFRYNDNYIITQMTMYIADQTLSSMDGKLTEEMKEVLGTMVSGESISVNCRVRGKDGISRLKGGTFTIE